MKLYNRGTFMTEKYLPRLRKELIALYILNTLDAIFTILLCETGYFVEVNPIMNQLLETPILLIIIKFTIPAFLFIFIIQRMKHATRKQLRISYIILTSFSVGYSLVIALHIFYTITIVIPLWRYNLWNYPPF